VKDCVEAAKLIFMTGERIFKYVFYPEMDKTLVILRQLFQMEANEFTYKNAYIAEIDGQVAGLILFVDQKDMQNNKKEMGKKVIKLIGFFQTLKRIYRFTHVERLIEKIDEKTIYIKHLATFKEFRGRGIATGLLAFCEQQSKKKDSSKLALDVETDNTIAIQFYENIGFRVVQEIKSNRFYERSGLKDLYRMIRKVPYSET
jgi:ribosomal protein S18 acetylase RimI-like enzyme